MVIFDASEWAAADSALADQLQTDKQNAAFFSRFGFTYENLTAAPGPHEFAGLEDPAEAIKSFRISSRSEPALSACFTEAELHAIFDRLHDTLHSMIELECYRKAAGGKN